MNCRRSMRLLRLCIALFALTCCSAGQGNAASPARRVVVVLLPGLRTDDLNAPEMQPVDELMAYGAAGWMVCRAALPPSAAPTASGHDSTEALLLTLGAGARAATQPDWAMRLAQNSGKITQQRGIPDDLLRELFALNRSLDHKVDPGALGDLVHAAGLQSGVLTDADAETAYGLLVGMDHLGTVDIVTSLHGNVFDGTAGRLANIAAILMAYDRLPARVGLAVIVTRELELNMYNTLSNVAGTYRKSALANAAALLAAVHRRILLENTHGAHTILMVCAPGSPLQSDRWDRAAPILMWGDGIEPGSLTSASTRRPGLVVNTDLLPTISRFLRQPVPSGMVGRPIVSRPTSHPVTLRDLRAAHDQMGSAARLQSVYGGLPTIQMLLALCGAIAMTRRSGATACATAAAMSALPLGMLILPRFAGGDILRAGLMLAIFAAIAAGLAYRWSMQPGGTAASVFYTLCAALVGIIVTDLLTGLHLLRDAWMSYSAMEGARYYGIGNEYMGAVIGASCVLFPLLLQGAGKSHPNAALPLVSGFYIVVLAAMSAPAWGAKVGAIPSAGCGFGVLLLTWRRGRVRARDLGLLLAGAMAILTVFVFVDLRHGSEQSHLARAIVGTGGDNLLHIAQRKLLLEGRLLLRSSWNGPLLVSGGILWWLRRRRQTPTQEEHAVFGGIAVGAAACLLFNDSGITAATMTLLYGCARVLTLGARMTDADAIPDRT